MANYRYQEWERLSNPIIALKCDNRTIVKWFENARNLIIGPMERYCGRIETIPLTYECNKSKRLEPFHIKDIDEIPRRIQRQIVKRVYQQLYSINGHLKVNLVYQAECYDKNRWSNTRPMFWTEMQMRGDFEEEELSDILVAMGKATKRRITY